VFFGTPAFAVPTFERLAAGPHAVVAAVTQPDRPRGRGRPLSESPVAQAAARARVPLLRPERVGDAGCVDRLRALAADLGVVVAFGQFLPRSIRELPRLGFLINAHASLLPRHRGAAPIAHAILAGDAETGISVMRVEREMDAGPVATVLRTPIGRDETAGELEQRLAALAAEAVANAVDAIARGRIDWTEQDPSRATFAPKLAPEHGRLAWSEPAEALARRVRALSPRPGAWTTWKGERLRILRARALAPAAAGEASSPGTVRTDPLRVATGAGWLLPLELQRPGGRPLDAEAFQRGRPIPDGARLGGDREATPEGR
jgi:methionyl-tRNA formyltransferase